MDQDAQQILDRLDKILSGVMMSQSRTSQSSAALEQQRVRVRAKSDVAAAASSAKALKSLSGAALSSVTSLNQLSAAASGGASSINTLSTAAKSATSSFDALRKLDSAAFAEVVSSFSTASAAVKGFNPESITAKIAEAISAASPTTSAEIPKNASGAASVLSDLIDRTNKVSEKFGTLASMVRAVNGALHLMTKQVRDEAGRLSSPLEDFSKGIGRVSSTISRKAGLDSRFEHLARSVTLTSVALRGLRGAIRGGGHGGGGGGGHDDEPVPPKDLNTGGSSLLKVLKANTVDSWGKWLKEAGLSMLRQAAIDVKRNLVQIVDDLFQTIYPRGYSASSLIPLYKNAIFAGQSLQEYARMMDESMGVVSRFSSFKEFDDALSEGRSKLLQFGIAGSDATKMTMSVMNASQSLGVPMDDMSKAMDGQVAVFKELRKTTGMTSVAFETLVRDLMQSDVVQRELIGLAPNERAARQTELTQMAAWGKSLGLTEQASSALTQAMLAQRRATVKDRFAARGRLTQAMSLVGMDPAAIAEAATLAGKRMKTPEETQRLTQLLGEYQQTSEQMLQNGGAGLQYQIETANANLDSTTLKPLLDASIAVRSAEQSGAQKQKDFGSLLGETNQILAKGFGVLEGIAKSPLVQLGGAAISALGAAALYLGSIGFIKTFSFEIGKAVGMAVRSMGGKMGPEMPAVPDSPGAGKGKWAGRLGEVGVGRGLVAGLGGVLAGAEIYSAYKDKEEADKKGDVKGSNDAKASMVNSGAMGAGTLLMTLAPLLGPGAPIAMGLGVVATALGAFNFGSWFTKEETAIEKQTRETEELRKTMSKANKLNETSNVLARDNLANLTSSVRSSAASMVETTTAEADKARRSKMTADERKAEDAAVDKEIGRIVEAKKNTAEYVTADGFSYTAPYSGKDAIPASAAAKAAMPMQIPTPIASPVEVPKSGVRNDVNTAPPTATPTAQTTQERTTSTSSDTATDVLRQIFELLRSQMMPIEERSARATEELMLALRPSAKLNLPSMETQVSSVYTPRTD